LDLINNFLAKNLVTYSIRSSTLSSTINKLDEACLHSRFSNAFFLANYKFAVHLKIQFTAILHFPCFSTSKTGKIVGKVSGTVDTDVDVGHAFLHNETAGFLHFD
jgi:hypothetical protein